MHLGGNVTVATIQAFVLVTLYMLGSCQPNGAFLFFGREYLCCLLPLLTHLIGIAVRAAYSIGVHRTEINARFGTEIQRQRYDRIP